VRSGFDTNDGALADLIATKCPKDMWKRKTADSQIIFLDNGARSTVDHSKSFTGVKSSSPNVELQDSEIQVRWENS